MPCEGLLCPVAGNHCGSRSNRGEAGPMKRARHCRRGRPAHGRGRLGDHLGRLTPGERREIGAKNSGGRSPGRRPSRRSEPRCGRMIARPRRPRSRDRGRSSVRTIGHICSAARPSRAGPHAAEERCGPAARAGRPATTRRGGDLEGASGRGSTASDRDSAELAAPAGARQEPWSARREAEGRGGPARAVRACAAAARMGFG